MRTLMRGDIGTFIVAGFCLPSLQPKLFPCRTLPSGIRNVVDKSFFYERSIVLRCSPKILPMLCPILIGPLFHQGFHTKDELNFLLAHGHRPIRPTRLGLSGLVFYFYPLHSFNNIFSPEFPNLTSLTKQTTSPTKYNLKSTPV